MLHVAFVRSELAHGRILGRCAPTVEVPWPGVVAIFAAADIAPDLFPIPGMQNRPPKAWRDAVEHEAEIPDQPILATDKVRHVGEAIAVVVAENRYAPRTPLRW